MRSSRVLPFALLLLVAASTRAADPLDQQHTDLAAKSPAGVSFILTLDKAAYHAGERIAVTLTFTSSIDGKYTCDMATYDRSGRMFEDTYLLDPADAADPLRDYFANVGGFMLGGLSQIPPLAAKPLELHVDLNEWLRIDHPGTHHLFAASTRVQIAGDTSPRLATASNIVTFEILPPDPAWSQAQLADIQKILDGHPEPQERADALRRLRFLNTPDASRELARRLDGSVDDTWDLQAGLIGAADRAAALHALEQRLVAPDQAVTPRFLATLQLLALLQSPHPAPALPRIIGMSPAETPERRAALEKYMPALIASLPAKTASARAVSLAALMRPPAAQVIPADPQLATQFAALFDDLPLKDKIAALQANWLRTQSPTLLPHLLKLLAAPTDDGNEALTLRDWALLRAYQLDPQTARPLLLAEMKSPRLSKASPLTSRMHSLLALPDDALPELDDDFAALVASSDFYEKSAAVRMIARYGSKNILPQMQAFFEPHIGRWACDIQSGMLAYFLRVDPDYGQQAFAQCLAARNTGCWRDLFREVGHQVWTPELESIAAESLSNPDAPIPLSAASMLKTHGSPSAIEPLLAALADPYIANPDPQRPGSQQPGSRTPESQRRYALVDALLHGHRWVLTPQQLETVQSHAVDPESLQACQQEAQLKVLPIQLQHDADGATIAYLNTEPFRSLDELETKLAAFPASLPLHVTKPSPTDPAEKSLRAWAAVHNRHIE